MHPPVRARALADYGLRRHRSRMFLVTEAEAAAIYEIFEREGELSAAIEVRRLFPGITDNVKARAYARTITGWKPPPVPACPLTRLHPEKER
jgi:hypothetical protein